MSRLVRACSSAASAAAAGGRGLVLGAHRGPSGWELTPAAAALDQRAGGALSRQLQEVAGQLRTGRALVVSLGEAAEGATVALGALGPPDVAAGHDPLEDLDAVREGVRGGVGAAVALLASRGMADVLVDGCGRPDAAAEGAELAAWKFQAFKTSTREPETTVRLLDAERDEGAAAAWADGAVGARAQNWARYLSDMPANHMTPSGLAQAALDVLCPLGVKVEAHEQEWIEAQNMRAFMAVARGSCEPPMFLDCAYEPAGSTAPSVLIVAKGVTFDSGGLCLKRPESMVENRGSMAGAAAALAALRGLAELRAPVNVRLAIPLCENMISGQCMKVGDVVPALNGLSIQIEDTDMEGRLMLADALVYGQARHKPALVVDVATLTDGVRQATGGGAYGAFTNSEPAWRALRAAGAHSGDRPWRFPLWAYYRRQITDDGAVDLRNRGSGLATPCLGAAFLQNFVCADWVHLDITGVGKLAHDAAPYLPARRMTGRPTRALLHFLRHTADPQPPTPTTAHDSCSSQARPHSA